MPNSLALPELPVTEVLPDLLTALSSGQHAVLEAPPGAGKTTLVPLSLLREPWLGNSKIIMLEPRRMAARAAAERMSELLGEPVGATVGYRVRQESKVSPRTRIEVVTGGVFTRWLQRDPSLDGVGLVIFDEFHERHLDSDLSLALCLQGRELFRDASTPLKLLVMSATLDGDAVALLLGGAPQIRSQGRQFPVDIIYGASQTLGEPLAGRVIETVRRVIDSETGNLLVFLPGQREIAQVLHGLAGGLPDDVDAIPLHGALSLAQQRQAIAPPAPGPDGRPRRKLVLSTDIAESSLTIEGVRVVIDAGRSREPAFDPTTGMTRLTTRRVSQASSTQRCGRAGRLEPGRCYRLWSKEQQHQLTPQTTPEILQADLSPLALQLLRWGVDRPDELRWLDAPPTAAYNQGLDLLSALGAIQQSSAGVWQLTDHGEKMSDISAHPRVAHLLLKAKSAGQLELGTALAALLSEPLRQQRSADIGYPLALVSGTAPCPKHHKSWLERTQKLQQNFARQMQPLQTELQTEESLAISSDDAPGYLLACAFPDRIAVRRSGQHRVYQLANGRSANLPEGESLANNAWLACAEVGGSAANRGDTIFSAAVLNPSLFKNQLEPLTRQVEVMEWDRQAGRFRAEQQVRLGSLTIDSTPIANPSPAKRVPALLEFVRKQGLELLPWSDELQQWRARIQLLRGLEYADNQWPDLSDEALLETMHQWLAPYLENVRSLEDFQRLNLREILQVQLPWPLPQQLDQLAPQALTVPSGSRIAVDYLQSPPVLAVKLQEMFGCEQTPRVGGGKVPVLIHLLSPARRPLQITQDLAGFWRNGYQEVKKEMKGRYPKHPWPDDPLQAPPSRYTKRRDPN